MAPAPSVVAVAVESDDDEVRKASMDDQKVAISFVSGSTFAFCVSMPPSTSPAKQVIGCCCGDDWRLWCARTYVVGIEIETVSSLLPSSGLEDGSGEDGGRVSGIGAPTQVSPSQSHDRSVHS